MAGLFSRRLKYQLLQTVSLIALLFAPSLAMASAAVTCPVFSAATRAAPPAESQRAALRAAVIRAYMRWNGRFPQEGGALLVTIGMASVVMRDPLAIEEIMKPLTDAEADQVGAATDVFHAQYNVPMRFDPGAMVITRPGPNGPGRFGRGRLRQLYAGFANNAIVRLIGFVGLTDSAREETWSSLVATLSDRLETRLELRIDGPIELPPMLVDYLTSPEFAASRAPLAWLGEAIDGVLLDVARGAVAEAYRRGVAVDRQHSGWEMRDEYRRRYTSRVLQESAPQAGHFAQWPLGLLR